MSHLDLKSRTSTMSTTSWYNQNFDRTSQNRCPINYRGCPPVYYENSAKDLVVNITSLSEFKRQKSVYVC